MPCKVCENLEELEKVSRDIGVEFKYCPACGSDIRISNFLKDAKEFVDKIALLDAYGRALLESKTVVVDGEELIFERQVSEPRKSKLMDMKIDLDKIDISKEQMWLEFFGQASWIKKKKEETDA